MVQKVEIDGAEVEVYTAAEREADIAAAVAAKEGEFQPKLTAAAQELADARKALADRAGEFQQFRKLSDEQVEKLSAAERLNYENGLVIAKQQEDIAARDKAAHDSAVNAAIKAKAGSDATLSEKLTEMYKIINIDDSTPEGIAARTAAALGAIGGTQPDLLAAAGVSFGGSFAPPVENKEEKSFADTEAGKNLAASLGLDLEPKKTN